jgi:hypothetical protein
MQVCSFPQFLPAAEPALLLHLPCRCDLFQPTECKPGYGKQYGSSSCTKCAAGTYQAGFAGSDVPAEHGYGELCIACPSTLSVFISSKGREADFTSHATTFRAGAAGEEECVPQTAQIGVDAGARIFNDAAMHTAAETTLEGCLGKCDAGSCCFVQFDYGHLNRQPAHCSYVNLAPSSDPNAYKNTSDAAAALLFYKLPPSGAITAASIESSTAAVDAVPESIVKGKVMSSGLYARCIVESAPDVGRALGIEVNLSTSQLSDCKLRCDMMSTCFGFTVHAGSCSLRGATDAADVRTLFNNPAAATIVDLHW